MGSSHPVSQETLEDVESHLQEVLRMAHSELDVDGLIAVESASQRIHSEFGGEEPEPIYPELSDDA